MSNYDVSVKNNSKSSPKRYEAGVIKKIEQDEMITIKRAVNHQEIAIMESAWKELKQKINLLTLDEGFDGKALLYGALLPYVLSAISDATKGNQPDFVPILICVLLIWLYPLVSKKVPQLRNDKGAESKVYLSELKRMLDEVESCQSENE